MYVHQNDFSREAMFRKVGEATSILLNCERKKYGISSIGAFVLPYAKLNQIAVFYGRTHYPGAYVTWAYVTDATLARLRRDPGMLLDIEELNAGDNLVIIDLVSNLRDLRQVISRIKEISLGDRERIYGLRYCKSRKDMVVREYRSRSLSK